MTQPKPPSPRGPWYGLVSIGFGGATALGVLMLVERVVGFPLQESWQLLLGLFLVGFLASAFWRWVYRSLYRRATG